jgi:serine/threonine protein kinase
LLEKLLQKDPKLRLGSSLEGFNEIMNHPWFKQIDWQSLKNK